MSHEFAIKERRLYVFAYTEMYIYVCLIYGQSFILLFFVVSSVRDKRTSCLDVCSNRNVYICILDTRTIIYFAVFRADTVLVLKGSPKRHRRCGNPFVSPQVIKYKGVEKVLKGSKEGFLFVWVFLIFVFSRSIDGSHLHVY